MASQNQFIDNSANMPSTTLGGFFSGLTGLITKAADTYVDLQTINAAKNSATKTAPQVTQVNPDAAAQLSFNWKPLAIGAGIFLAAIVGTALIFKAVK